MSKRCIGWEVDSDTERTEGSEQVDWVMTALANVQVRKCLSILQGPSFARTSRRHVVEVLLRGRDDVRGWVGQEQRVAGRGRHGLTIGHYHAHQSSFLITSHVSPCPTSSYASAFFLSEVEPSRGFLLLFGGSHWFFKLPGLFLFFLRLLLLLFFLVFYPSSVVDPLFNFSFLVPPSVTFGHGDGIEILWRVLFLRRFLFYLTFYKEDGCWKLGVLRHSYVIAWYVLTHGDMILKICW